MAKDLNNWMGVGRTTKDAEITTSRAGLTICKFSIAVNGWKDGDVSFFNCTMFGKFAEGVGKYITKGKRMAISAELKQDKWQDKNTGQNRYAVGLIVKDLQLLDGGQSAKATESLFNTKDSTNFEEDIPF